jgi:hypothetical protein
MNVVLTISDDVNESASWGVPSCELVWLESLDDGLTWTSRFLTDFDPETPRWLPSIERQTGFNTVETPSIIYTSGDPGAGLGDLLKNDIIWMPLAPMVPGDANSDGRVDEKDASVLAHNWGAVNATMMMGDFDGDGRVGLADAAILAANWGHGPSESQTVPEPGTLALLLAMAWTLLPFHRRRR